MYLFYTPATFVSFFNLTLFWPSTVWWFFSCPSLPQRENSASSSNTKPNQNKHSSTPSVPKNNPQKSSKVAPSFQFLPFFLFPHAFKKGVLKHIIIKNTWMSPKASLQQVQSSNTFSKPFTIWLVCLLAPSWLLAY